MGCRNAEGLWLKSAGAHLLITYSLCFITVSGCAADAPALVVNLIATTKHPPLQSPSSSSLFYEAVPLLVRHLGREPLWLRWAWPHTQASSQASVPDVFPRLYREPGWQARDWQSKNDSLRWPQQLRQTARLPLRPDKYGADKEQKW